MSSNDPEAIRADIERTRAEISNDVNALAEGADPRRIAGRQVQKVKDGARSLVDKVFGSDDDATGYREPGVLEGARSAVAQAPAQVRSSTRGNPLVAGAVAFGVGFLAAGLLPSSRQERQLARNVKEQAQPLVDEVAAVAKDAAANLQPAAQQAAETVKQVAADAVETVKGEAGAAAADVKESAQQATESVKDTAQQAAGAVQGSAPSDAGTATPTTGTTPRTAPVPGPSQGGQPSFGAAQGAAPGSAPRTTGTPGGQFSGTGHVSDSAVPPPSGGSARPPGPGGNPGR